MWTLSLQRLVWSLLLLAVDRGKCQSVVPPVGSDYNEVNTDGSYRYGFQTGDAGAHYQAVDANQKNQVAGRFGSWDPERRRIVDTQYRAGRRGFRAQGPNIARKMDLSQVKIPYNPPVNPNSPNYRPTYDGYHDPNEDPSYSFQFRTPTYTKSEVADSNGRVNGDYSYFDDIGERHDVKYYAGAKTGFNVLTPFPDSKVFTGLFYKGPPGKGGNKPRGKSSIQQNLDGSYKFVSTGPDQRRTEESDSSRNVRGSYTYIDDKGQQRTVEYIAGPNIGYRIVKKGIGLNLPPSPSFNRPPNFTNLPDVIGPTSRPPGTSERPTGSGNKPFGSGSGSYGSGNKPFVPGSGSYGSGNKPFGSGSGSYGSGNKPFGSGSGSYGSGNKPFDSGDESYGPGSRPSDSDDSQHNTNRPWFTGSPISSEDSGKEENSSGEKGTNEQGEDNVSGSIPDSEGDLSWPSTNKPPTSKPPGGPGGLFHPIISPGLRPSPTLPPNTFTSTSTESTFTGYPSGRPGSGTQLIPFPNNCCGQSSSTVRPELPVSAFPEDDPNKSRPPRPNHSEDDFLQAPFEDLPPKEYGSRRPSSRPNYFYKPPPQQTDSTFLSSNKNYFSFPHGVAVRAHIQSLDILPFGSRIPPPGIALEQGISHSG